MKLNKIIKVLTIAVAFMLGSIVVNAQDNVLYLPCDSTAKGYYYSYERVIHTPDLRSDMPLDILVGYIIADSALRNMKPTEVWDFVKTLGDNDTLKYILKYMYLLSDYDPIRYCRFQLTHPSHTEHWASGYYASEDILKKVSVLPDSIRRGYAIASDYILHLIVNETITTEIPEGIRCKSLIAGHSTVLDKIKGQILPPLGHHYGLSNNGGAGIVAPIMPNPTNFVFEYCPNWGKYHVINDDGTIMPNIICEDGSPWIKAGKEYIVFVTPIWECSYETIAYYVMYPIMYDYSKSYGMYPIEDGNVIDKGNSFGWGEVVPVETFKQNLRDYIDTIKNYNGE